MEKIDKESYKHQRSRAMYWWYGGHLGVKIEKQDNGIVSVTQLDAEKTGRIFTQKQLHDIGKGFYPKQHVHPHVFKFEGDNVTPEWIKDKMIQYGVKQKDIVKNTGLNGSNVSAFISGLRPMSKGVKALFFYYFTLFEANCKLHVEDPKPDYPPVEDVYPDE